MANDLTINLSSGTLQVRGHKVLKYSTHAFLTVLFTRLQQKVNSEKENQDNGNHRAK